jgi:hypothetical protein
MSYDIYVNRDSHNHTSNTAKLFSAVIPNELYSLEELTPKEAIPVLKNAIHELKMFPENYRKYEPENKWGTVESSTVFLYDILVSCLENKRSKKKIEIH